MKSFPMTTTANNTTFENTIPVRETTNYEIFRGWNHNRNLRSTNQLEDDLLEIGHMVIPVIVDSNFNIYDGHHRVRAAMNCQMPVRYIIDDKITLEQIKVLNRGQKNWNTTDHIESYAKQGKGHYRTIKQFIGEFKGTSPGLAMTVLSDKLRTSGDKEFKDGNFKIITDAIVQKNRYKKIYEGLGAHKIRLNAKFAHPLMQFMKEADFDFDWFCKQFKSRQYIIPNSVNNTRTALDIIRDVLNHQAQEERKQGHVGLIRKMEDKHGW